jgi:hypothetical protein
MNLVQQVDERLLVSLQESFPHLVGRDWHVDVVIRGTAETALAAGRLQRQTSPAGSSSGPTLDAAAIITTQERTRSA